MGYKENLFMKCVVAGTLNYWGFPWLRDYIRISYPAIIFNYVSRIPDVSHLCCGISASSSPNILSVVDTELKKTDRLT